MSTKSKTPTWITEEAAAEMLGLAPRTFRRYVKDPFRAMGINYTHVNNRNFKYNKHDIEAYMMRQSTMYVRS